MAARLRSMLPQSASGPFEDHDLMSLEFKAQVFLTAAWVPSYGDWFLDCDMEPMYRYELRVLKLLQWKCPPNRWQLKSPTHTLFLDAFEKVFPEARFVMTHRDVSKVLPSVSDLYYTLLQMGSDDIDPVAVGDLNMRQWGTAIDRVLAFRASGRDDKFYDIGFTAFQADPIAEIRALYDWLGRRAHARNRGGHARVASRQPARQARVPPVRRQRVRPHRAAARRTVQCVSRALPGVPELGLSTALYSPASSYRQSPISSARR